MSTESLRPGPQHGVFGLPQKTARGVRAQNHGASRAARGPSPMQATLCLYRRLFANGTYLRSLSQGVAFLAASMIAIFAAVTFATANASNHVADLVLSNVGPYNMRFAFVYGTFAMFGITTVMLASRPNRLPFALKALALFLVVRAVFVPLMG